MTLEKVKPIDCTVILLSKNTPQANFPSRYIQAYWGDKRTTLMADYVKTNPLGGTGYTNHSHLFNRGLLLNDLTLLVPTHLLVPQYNEYGEISP